MMNTYHCLITAGYPAKIKYKTTDESFDEAVEGKLRKLIRQLTGEKTVHPEKAGDIDWMIENIEKGINDNRDIHAELKHPTFFVKVDYEPKDRTCVITKELDAVMSIRSYQEQ